MTLMQFYFYRHSISHHHPELSSRKNITTPTSIRNGSVSSSSRSPPLRESHTSYYIIFKLILRLLQSCLINYHRKMSYNNSAPSCSNSSFHDTEKCLFSFRVVNRIDNTSCCLTCFCESGLINRVQNFEIFINHLISNGPYTPWVCSVCHWNNIQVRPAALCTVCMHALALLQIKLRRSRIDLSTTHFLYNHFTHKFEFVGATLPRNE